MRAFALPSSPFSHSCLKMNPNANPVQRFLSVFAKRIHRTRWVKSLAYIDTFLTLKGRTKLLRLKKWDDVLKLLLMSTRLRMTRYMNMRTKRMLPIQRRNSLRRSTSETIPHVMDIEHILGSGQMSASTSIGRCICM